MGLTDEQYNQVMRYVDGEMNTKEKNGFEVLVSQNKELSDEVMLYREIRAVSKSLANKVSDDNLLHTEEQANEEHSISAMIKRVRANWQKSQGPSLEEEGQFNPPSSGVHSNVHDIINRYPENLPTEPGSRAQKNIIHRDDHINRLKGFTNFKWLTAAALIIFLGSLLILWYQHKKNDLRIAENRNRKDATLSSKREKTVHSKATIHDSSLLQHEPIIQENKMDTENLNAVAKARHSSTIASSKRNTLFKKYFQPDSVPADVAGPLRKALEPYKENDYNSALIALQKSKTLAKRGPDESDPRATFYIDYYQAQSYMALDKIDKAVPMLKSAIKSVPDNLLKNKARWYLALAYLKLGELNNTEALLHLLSKEKQAEAYREKAIKLMKALNRNRSL